MANSVLHTGIEVHCKVLSSVMTLAQIHIGAHKYDIDLFTNKIGTWLNLFGTVYSLTQRK